MDSHNISSSGGQRDPRAHYLPLDPAHMSPQYSATQDRPPTRRHDVRDGIRYNQPLGAQIDLSSDFSHNNAQSGSPDIDEKKGRPPRQATFDAGQDVMRLGARILRLQPRDRSFACGCLIRTASLNHANSSPRIWATEECRAAFRKRGIHDLEAFFTDIAREHAEPAYQAAASTSNSRPAVRSSQAASVESLQEMIGDLQALVLLKDEELVQARLTLADMQSRISGSRLDLQYCYGCQGLLGGDFNTTDPHEVMNQSDSSTGHQYSQTSYYQEGISSATLSTSTYSNVQQPHHSAPIHDGAANAPGTRVYTSRSSYHDVNTRGHQFSR
ncbi:hypothetical protein EIP91_005527 [Steccherinum ochraceum]|uniref:Uncharacterized protein n=1 Tax=Steccherinum ochraceum TaxID=92696 RepID=A0A4R0RSC3_9APHY|nr:hypothetical protein EIP91_005527 [Steccherinum ochraceum]